MVSTPGTNYGQILVQSTTTSDSVSVAVTMVVSANAALSVTPSQVSFYYTTGSAAPAVQQVTVNSNGGLVNFSVSQSPNSTWLHVTPISSAANTNAPATLQFSVTPTAPVLLTPNTYSATITINPSNGGSAPQINVSLLVSNNPFLTVSTAPNNQMAFSAPFGGTAPGVQSITVGSSGSASISFTATATSDKGWLTVLPTAGNTATSGTLQVGVISSVLGALGIGTYTGTITVAPTNGDNYTIPIAVTLTVGATSTITAAPQSLVFSYETSQTAPQPETVMLAATGPPLGFTLATSVSNTASCGSANWLQAIAQQSPLVTPNVLAVSVSTAGMTPGICSGTVRVQYSASLAIPSRTFRSRSSSALPLCLTSACRKGLESKPRRWAAPPPLRATLRLPAPTEPPRFNTRSRRKALRARGCSRRRLPAARPEPLRRPRRCRSTRDALPRPAPIRAASPSPRQADYHNR